MRKALSIRRSKKEDRERRILISLVELYLKNGKPIGSSTLQERGFPDISSATIRNYFTTLEASGYLVQHHASGGRIPTAKAYRLYAAEQLQPHKLSERERKALQPLRQETKEIASYLQDAAELLSRVTGLAVFLAAPRFDHDFVLEMKIVALDRQRILCVMITDFGSVLTEILHTDHKLSSFALRRIEQYFTWRLTGQEIQDRLEAAESELAQRFYNELMVRYITRYSSFSEEEVYQTGFSRLLKYPEFSAASTLANALSFFENAARMRLLLRDTVRQGALRYWIGEDLSSYSRSASAHCSVIAIPYRVNQIHVGAVGVLGPTRVPYPKIFAQLNLFSELVSETLSRSLYKFRIQYRQPEHERLFLLPEERLLLEGTTQGELQQPQGNDEYD